MYAAKCIPKTMYSIAKNVGKRKRNLQDFVVQNNFLYKQRASHLPQLRDCVTQLRARSHDCATAGKQASAVDLHAHFACTKKHTSVRNGGIQRRSPKRGGFMPGPKYMKK